MATAKIRPTVAELPKAGTPAGYQAGMWGRRIRSRGKGRGLGIGRGRGPIGVPIKEK